MEAWQVAMLRGVAFGRYGVSTMGNGIRDAKLITIGNSKGIRLPKALLQKYGWTDSLVLEEMEKGVLLYRQEEK